MASRTHAGAVPSTLPRHQILDEQGAIADDALLSPYVADVTVEQLQHLYRSMTGARRAASRSIPSGNQRAAKSGEATIR